MRVLMLGWEFPPYISGGLGTACFGLTQGLSHLGAEITFVLPHSIISKGGTGLKLLGPGSLSQSGKTYSFEKMPGVKFKPIDIELYPYGKPGCRQVPVGQAGLNVSSPQTRKTETAAEKKKAQVLKTAAGAVMSGGAVAAGQHYGRDLFWQVNRYADLVLQVASQESFEVIHAHDWMTYPAAIAAADYTGKPLVVHVHSTERDRSGEHVNQNIYNIERHGMHRADRVVTVSRYTQRMCEEHYGLDARKVNVVYNAVEGLGRHDPIIKGKDEEKVVLFLGRITMQKGPEYFLMAAKKVLDIMDNVKFVMAGTGDMLHRMINLAAELGIGHKVLFTGFLRGADVTKAFSMADLYVMPSVSEPFGIAPLEALSNNVPVMISRQSGVSEVLTNVLKVDFWDVQEIANKMAAVLKYPALPQTLRQNGSWELKKFDWTESAKKCLEVYRTVLGKAS